VPGSAVPPDLTPTDIEEYLDGTKFGQQGPLIRKKPKLNSFRFVGRTQQQGEVTVAIDINALPDSSVGFKTHWGMDEFLFTAQGNDLNHGRKADKVVADGFGLRVKNSLAGQMEGNAKLKGCCRDAQGQDGRDHRAAVWFVPRR